MKSDVILALSPGYHRTFKPEVEWFVEDMIFLKSVNNFDFNSGEAKKPNRMTNSQKGNIRMLQSVALVI